ncbi:MAG: hypothetical protein V4486_00640 [Patescibacteria group bacterium]
MINADLLNYIKQAQLSGKSIEVIKQELATGGWNAADVAEALQSLSVGVSAVTPAMAATAGGMGMKAIITILVLVVLAAGGYFAYSKYKQPSVEEVSINQEQTMNTPTPTPVAQNTESIPAPFTCKDIFTESDFVRITGKGAADYKVEEKTSAAANAGNSANLTCSYTKPDPSKSDPISFNLTVIWYPINNVAETDLEVSTDALVQSAKSMAAGFPDSEAKTQQMNIAKVAVPGVGAKAYTLQSGSMGGGWLFFLSSNKKYNVMFTYLDFANLGKANNGALTKEKLIGQTIDAHLSKY